MAAEASIPHLYGGVGTTLDLGSGARLVIVDTAEGAATFHLTHGDASIAILVCQPLAGCRPSPTAASAEVLLGDGRAMRRRLEDDAFLHGTLVRVAAPLPGERFTPAPEPGPPLLAAPVHGWIRLLTDGRRLEVRAQRPP
jgi:hypothetical protein